MAKQPYTEAKARANKKWDEANKDRYSRLVAVVYKDERDQFNAYAKRQGKSASGLLCEYIRACIASEAADKPAEQ